MVKDHSSAGDPPHDADAGMPDKNSARLFIEKNPQMKVNPSYSRSGPREAC
jgi:hypothetical protein